MKKIFLNLFVLSALVLTASCSSDSDSDDGNGNASNELKVTIDGQQKVFDNVIVNVSSDDGGFVDVSATIGNQANELFSFTVFEGETGSQAIWSFYYNLNGEYFDNNTGGSGVPNNYLNMIVTVNNGSRFTATFTGVLVGDYDEISETYNTVTIENGSIDVEY